MNKAYSLIDITKAVTADGGDVTITGIASTIQPDRSNDIVDPSGAKFKLPMPLLWQHDHTDPIGVINKARQTPNGIEIEATIKPVTSKIKSYVDMIKAGLVRGLSIGFRPLKYKQIKGGGVHYTEFEWYELSCVTLPCNAESNITNVKRFDSEPLSLEQMAKESSALPKIEKSETPRLNKAKLTLIKLGK
jgi:HK97 family phage prohead protease